MIREVKFESQDRRMKQILAALNKHGIKDIEVVCTFYTHVPVNATGIFENFGCRSKWLFGL